ncbi:hypothetical protein PVK06_048916 [Gossypium arboreum]|uniref:Reverse transcriptase domain-containing protein n=1 Tax=Gossypium arboreum TaxID=29729 RepID=A0ABR0MHP8_GOSAR|nr:hypothetical protein PVK06_048916 [Gossypium arboreum]
MKKDMGTQKVEMMHDVNTRLGFIVGRNITDDVIIVQEVIHSIRGKNKKRTVTKIDLEKAYDKVRWDFIDKSIQAAGIPDYLRRVIMSAITTATMQVL